MFSQISILPLICIYNKPLYPVQTNLPPAFQGCYELVTSFMETNMAIIAGVTFGIAFSQVSVEAGFAGADVINNNGTCCIVAVVNCK